MAFVYNFISGATETLKKVTGLSTIKTHTVYVPSLNDGTIVDLGANVGEFASAMADRGLTCHAVEAEPTVFQQIPDREEIKKHNLAISNKDGPVELFVSENRECNSVQPAIAVANGLKGNTICRGLTFQSFLSTNEIGQISLLKVDIEGSEEQLFDSTPDEVLRSIDQITIEFHDFVPGSISADKVQQISERLERLGFYRMPFSYMYPQMLTADILFLRLDYIPIWKRTCFAAIVILLSVQRAKAQLRAA